MSQFFQQEMKEKYTSERILQRQRSIFQFQFLKWLLFWVSKVDLIILLKYDCHCHIWGTTIGKSKNTSQRWLSLIVIVLGTTIGAHRRATTRRRRGARTVCPPPPPRPAIAARGPFSYHHIFIKSAQHHNFIINTSTLSFSSRSERSSSSSGCRSPSCAEKRPEKRKSSSVEKKQEKRKSSSAEKKQWRKGSSVEKLEKRKSSGGKKTSLNSKKWQNKDKQNSNDSFSFKD